MEEIREILMAIQFSAMSWVIVTMLTSLLHYFNIHTLDRFICLKCTSFWFTLIITQNIFIAAVASFISFLIDKYLNSDTTTL